MLNNCPNKVGKCKKDINITIDIKVCVPSFLLISQSLAGVGFG